MERAIPVMALGFGKITDFESGLILVRSRLKSFLTEMLKTEF